MITKRRDTLAGFEITTRSRQNVGVHEQRFWSVYPPRCMRTSREREDFCIDKVSVQDGVPHGFLHGKGRREPFRIFARGAPKRHYWDGEASVTGCGGLGPKFGFRGGGFLRRGGSAHRSNMTSKRRLQSAIPAISPSLVTCST